MMGVSCIRVVLLALWFLEAPVLACVAFAASQTDEKPMVPLAPLHEEILSLPGDPDRPINLQTTLFTPDGKGPFPLAVMNHGATNISSTNRGDRYRFSAAAYYFLSRGYAVALPMARGFAGSGGNVMHLGCEVNEVARENGRDISAAIEALKLRPDIDRTRIAVAGQSFGAWTTLGLGVAPPAGVRGLISFNAAIRTSDCQSQDASMAAAASSLGASAKVPSLWFYGDNDFVMPESTWRSVYLNYQRAGAHAELVMFGRWRSDSHQFLSSSDSMPVWMPKVDAFLKEIGMPSEIAQPDYLPYSLPPPTNWATLTDVAAVPLANNDARALYQRFLTAPYPRAFVITPNGSVLEAHGGYDPAGRALRDCATISPGCRLYAVNDEVVWSGPKPEHAGEPPPRVVQKTVAMNASSNLGGFYALNPDCSPRGVPTVLIVETPVHGIATSGPGKQHPAFPRNDPFATCNTATVPTTDVSYTPTANYTGFDRLTIEEIGLDGKYQLIHIDLTIK
jgi:dienelactone hydrolase